MFNDADNGQTQYCSMCEEWARKYEELEKLNKALIKTFEEINEIAKNTVHNSNVVFIDGMKEIMYLSDMRDIK